MTARDAALEYAARRSMTTFGSVNYARAEAHLMAAVVEVVADVLGSSLPGGVDEFWRRIEAQIKTQRLA